MTRTDLINHIIRVRKYTSYLEIGAGDIHGNFIHVDCRRKLAVDPAPALAAGYLCLSSDDYFSISRASYDAIFIDGLHEEAQVNRDIRNGLAHLEQRGVVVLHDCLPPDEWHQRPASEYRDFESWNGTVWKAVLRAFACLDFDCYVVDCDWGCGIIDTASPRRRPCLSLPDRLDYDTHFPLLQPFVRPVEDFLQAFH